MTLILKHANKNRLGSIDWGQTISMYGGRPRYRANISVTAGTARTPVVLDNHCSRASAINSQSRLFSDTRASNDRFQDAVVKLAFRDASPCSHSRLAANNRHHVHQIYIKVRRKVIAQGTKLHMHSWFLTAILGFYDT